MIKLDQLPEWLRYCVPSNARLYAIALNEAGQVEAVMLMNWADHSAGKVVCYTPTAAPSPWSGDIHYGFKDNGASVAVPDCCGSMVVNSVDKADRRCLAILAWTFRRVLLQGQLSSQQSNDIIQSLNPFYISEPLLVNPNSTNSLRTWAADARPLLPLVKGLTLRAWSSGTTAGCSDLSRYAGFLYHAEWLTSNTPQQQESSQ